jgi:tetratricopeptide (TPR) repeat protein
LSAADVWLVRTEAAEVRADAVRLGIEGDRLVASGAFEEAVGRYRGALGLAPGKSRYRIALARALMHSERTQEARTVVDEVLRREANDGEANLTMARILTRLGRFEDAEAHYHRAILGRWPSSSTERSRNARLELIESLEHHGSRERLLAELRPLVDATHDPALERRLASLYRASGALEQARETWQALRRTDPNDADVHAGLGEAELALRNYRAAQASFRAALRLRPDDQRIRSRLELCADVLGLDPTRRGLTETERYRRSVELLTLARDSIARCPAAPDANLGAGQHAATAAVAGRNLETAVDANVDLAEHLWQARQRHCAASPLSPADERLALVLTRTGQ